jgi:hypothetical protein
LSSVAPFAEVSAVVATGPGRFHGDVHPAWTIGGKPNGGYLLAMLGRAATSDGPHPHVIAASAHYLRPPDPGPVEIETEVLRAGRTASQLRARLLQDGQPCIEALLTAAELSADTKPFWTAASPEPGTTSFAESFRLPPTSPTGLAVTIMGQVDLRIELRSLDFARGEPSGRGELRGWLALPGDEAFDPTALLYAIDSFPPATLDVALTGWVPTLELTGYVRALPSPGPVRVLHQAHLVDDQRVDETCWVWDSTGRLVARGVQLAGIRLG